MTKLVLHSIVHNMSKATKPTSRPSINRKTVGCRNVFNLLNSAFATSCYSR